MSAARIARITRIFTNDVITFISKKKIMRIHVSYELHEFTRMKKIFYQQRKK